ncbi:MAG: TonB-dependent receptor [Archangium sp.]
MKSLRLLFCLAVTPFAAFAGTPDGGTDELETGELAALLDTAVVSGPSRTKERVDDSPATVTVVTSAQLRTLGIRTVHEAMNFLSMGMVAQDPLHAVEVGARGVLLSGDYGNHFLVLIDGHAINEAWNGTAYFEQGLSLPIEMIDHIELILGPGSVLYGSNAMLGVVNIITRRADDVGRLRGTFEGALMPGQRADGSLFVGVPGLGGSMRLSLASGWSFNLAGSPFEITAALEYYVHQGQQLEFAKQTGLTESDGTSEWPQRWSRTGEPGTWGGVTDRYSTRVGTAWLKARWGDFTFFGRGATYGRSSPAIDNFGVAVNFDGVGFERDRFLDTELRWQRVLNPHFSMLVRAYFDDYEYLGEDESSSWLSNGSGELPADADLSNFTFAQKTRGFATWGGLEAQGTIDWLGDGRFPLMLGVDGRARRFAGENLTSTLDGELLATDAAYDVTEWQIAFYAQQRARLLPSLQLNAGVRVDTQSNFLPNVAPRGAVVWSTPWDGKVKAVFSAAFRSPSGYERFAEYAGFQVRNPLLQPERVITGELGYEQRLGRHRLGVVLFASSFTSLIVLDTIQVDGEDTHSYQNGGGLVNHGAQGFVEGAFGQLSYGASFTGAFNITKPGDELLASPTWFGNARATYSFGDELPKLSALVHFSGPRLNTAAANSGVDTDGNPISWNENAKWSSPQVELRGVLEGKVKQVPGLTLRGVVGGNLFPYSQYAVGPLNYPTSATSVPQLAPNNRLFVLLTVGWSLD